MAFNFPQLISPRQTKTQEQLLAERNERIAVGRESFSKFSKSVGRFFKTAADRAKARREADLAMKAVKPDQFRFQPQIGGFKIPIPNLIGEGAVTTSEPARAQFDQNVDRLGQIETAFIPEDKAAEITTPTAPKAPEGEAVVAEPVVAPAITFKSSNLAFQSLIDQTNKLLETAKTSGALTPEIQDRINQINTFEAEKTKAIADARDAADRKDPAALNEAMAKVQDAEATEKDIVTELIEQMREARASFLEAGAPTERETEVRRSLQELRSGRQLLPLELRKEGISAEGIESRQIEDERVRAIQEGNLLFELGLEQEARQFRQSSAEQQIGFIRDDLDLQFKIEDRIASQEEKLFERARGLRKDSLSAASDILNTFEGLAFEDLDGESQEEVLNVAGSFNIPFSFLTSAMKAAKQRFIVENAKKLGVGAGAGVIVPQSPEEEQSVLRSLVSGLPVGQQDAMFGAISVFKNARDILALLDKGVKTGPVSGRLRSIGKALGTTGEDFNKFSAATTAFTANYIKALSGVQVSDKERQFLLGALPSETNQEQVNRDNISVLTDFLKNKLELQLGINVDNFPNEIPQPGAISLGVPEADAYLDFVLGEKE